MKNRINALLKEIGKSAYAFAKETGISSNTVYLLKNNPGQFPSSDVFARIIATYGVTPNDIVEFCGDQSDES